MTETRRPGMVAVDKYLLPNEVQVATVRRHPAVLIGPSVVALVGLLVAGALSATIAASVRPVLYVIWGIELILVLRLCWKAWNWSVDYFVVTSARLLLTSGVFTRKIAMAPLTKITDLSFQRSFSGRMLGFGEFIVETAGQHQQLSVVDHIPYPEDLYLLVCGMLFPEVLETPEAEEDDPDDEGVDDNPLPDDDLPGGAGGGPPYEPDGPDYGGPQDGATKVYPIVVEDGPNNVQWKPAGRFRRVRRPRQDPHDEG